MPLEADALGKIDNMVNVRDAATNPCANLHRNCFLRFAVEPLDLLCQRLQMLRAYNGKFGVDERRIRQRIITGIMSAKAEIRLLDGELTRLAAGFSL